jgi:hypothetical protein
VSSDDVEIPAGPLGPLLDHGPVFSWGEAAGADAPRVPELCDTSKPIALDERGNPLYAPRGIQFRLR